MVAEPRNAKVCPRTHPRNSFIAAEMPKIRAHPSKPRKPPICDDELMAMTVPLEAFKVVAKSGRLVIFKSVPASLPS
jgi:hypothetical protein